MRFAVYNKNFEILTSPKPLGTYSIKQRAYDFNDVKIVGSPIGETLNPFFVEIQTDLGKTYYTAIAGTPQLTADNQTSIQGGDLRKFFDTEIYYTPQASYANLKALIDDIVSVWRTQNGDLGVDITVDTSGITDSLDSTTTITEDKYNVFELLNQYCYYYYYVITSECIFKTKTVAFAFKKVKLASPKKITLSEYVGYEIKKSTPAINMATAKSGAAGFQYYLLNDGSITTTAADDKRIYPVYNQIYEEDDINTAVFDAVLALAKQRYQDSITIPIGKDNSLNNLTLYDALQIYIKNGSETTNEILPIGEIDYTQKGDTKIIAGYRPQLLTQIL